MLQHTKNPFAVEITEPSGKTYRIFADGHAEGFENGAVIRNNIPSLLTTAKNGWVRKQTYATARS